MRAALLALLLLAPVALAGGAATDPADDQQTLVRATGAPALVPPAVRCADPATDVADLALVSLGERAEVRLTLAAGPEATPSCAGHAMSGAHREFFVFGESEGGRYAAFRLDADGKAFGGVCGAPVDEYERWGTDAEFRREGATLVWAFDVTADADEEWGFPGFDLRGLPVTLRATTETTFPQSAGNTRLASPLLIRDAATMDGTF